MTDVKSFDELRGSRPAETEMIGAEKLVVNRDGRIIRGPSIPAAGVDQGDESEPNGTAATADALSGSEGRIEGLIYPAADEDYFSFTAASGDKVYVALMTSGDASGSTNSVLELVGTDGTTILETDLDDGTFGTTSSTIAGFNIPSAGTYYFKVRQNSATATIRGYMLYYAVRTGAAVAETEDNNTVGTATPLAASGHMSGVVSPAADLDFFSLTLNAGETVFLSLNIDPERDNVQWNGRLGFGLFGSGTPSILLLANDGSTGSATNPLSEAFFFTVKDAGSYVIYVDQATALGDPTFTYTMSATVFPANSDPSCTTYTSTDVPKTIAPDPALVSSTLTIPGNPRINSAQVFVDLTHTFIADLDVNLLSPRANENGLFSDIGPATVSGTQTGMNLWFDDEAAIPPVFAVAEDFRTRPEIAYSLEYFSGEDAGGTWQLDIRDDAAGDGGTLNGWAIRVCERPADPPSDTVYFQDFETDDGGFTHNGTIDEWEYGTPATVATTTTSSPIASFLNCNSGTKCWKTDLDGPYDNSSVHNLESPAIAIPAGSTDVRLSWAMRYQLESASFDHAWIEVFEAANPSNIKRIGEWTGSTMVNTVGNPSVGHGQSAGWANFASDDLSSFAGTSVIVRFHLDGDSSVSLGGVAIDDVKITRAVPGEPVRGDFDGDGKTDLSVYRPSLGNWYHQRSLSGFLGVSWGAPGDTPMAGDFDGDGITDMVVRRPVGDTIQADFHVLKTATFTYEGIPWGNPTDIALIGDYDADGKDEIAVYRPSDAYFYIRDEFPVYRAIPFGGSGDIPFAADFDGDDRTDLAVFRPSNGFWYYEDTATNFITSFNAVAWGLSSDKLVPADYDGDGKDDVAVYRPSDGTWYIRRSSDSQFSFVPWGLSSDIPVPGDYDGDGTYDIAVFRPSDGNWYIRQSSNSQIRISAWGANGDTPVPAMYLP